MIGPSAKAKRSVPRALAALISSSLVASGACNLTDNPREIYAHATAGARGGPKGPLGSGGTSVAGASEPSLSGKDSHAEPGATPGDRASGGSDLADAGESSGGTETRGSGGEAGQDGAGGGSGASGTPRIDCGSAPIVNGSFSREALRGAAADCAMWHHCQFENAASALFDSVRSYAESPGDGARAEAQSAFRAAMQSWSKLELFQFGPLASRSESAGKDTYQGQGLRELIYSWPSTARCRVEEQLASLAFVDKGVNLALISARGLFGIEYSLFYSDTDTACAVTSATGKLWPSLSEAELSQRKRDYALALAADVLAQARVMSQAWSADGGNFRPVFVSASGYPSEQEALNVLGFALIYIEREVKDWKLGIPAGYTLIHPVSGPETPFAQLGTENIRANLQGFRSLFEGCGPAGEGLGFDDWLSQAGHADLARDLLAALQTAQAAADAFPPLHLASPAEIEALYRALKGVTDLLKNDLFGPGSPLNLELPAGVEGDTD